MFHVLARVFLVLLILAIPARVFCGPLWVFAGFGPSFFFFWIFYIRFGFGFVLQLWALCLCLGLRLPSGQIQFFICIFFSEAYKLNGSNYYCGSEMREKKSRVYLE